MKKQEAATDRAAQTKVYLVGGSFGLRAGLNAQPRWPL